MRDYRPSEKRLRGRGWALMFSNCRIAFTLPLMPRFPPTAAALTPALSLRERERVPAGGESHDPHP